ncbi:small GTPase-binding protein [Flagelloscypha sp. PMI_526]|nr:small GTPase-binding protein [Flagelloscypha sp. PMI_526]
MPEYRRKLVIVGDGAVGKTSLLNRFAHGRDYDEYVPTVFESYVADLPVHGHNVELALWDTAGSEDYDRLRPLSYPDSHVVLIAFSLASPESLDNVQEKWIDEIRHFIPFTPTILVGCKKDIRNDESALKELAKADRWPVSSDEGMAMAAKVNARNYFECSSKTGEGVHQVFDAAARASMERRPCKCRKRNGCVIF